MFVEERKAWIPFSMVTLVADPSKATNISERRWMSGRLDVVHSAYDIE